MLVKVNARKLTIKNTKYQYGQYLEISDDQLRDPEINLLLANRQIIAEIHPSYRKNAYKTTASYVTITHETIDPPPEETQKLLVALERQPSQIITPVVDMSKIEGILSQFAETNRLLLEKINLMGVVAPSPIKPVEFKNQIDPTPIDIRPKKEKREFIPSIDMASKSNIKTVTDSKEDTQAMTTVAALNKFKGKKIDKI